MNPNNAIGSRIVAAIRPVANTQRSVRLAAAFDPQTSLHHFPPPITLQAQMTERLVGPVGTLHTYTRMHLPKAAGSYLIGFADFEGQVRILGRISSQVEPKCGDIVSVVAVDPADLSAGYLFEITEGPDV